MLENFDISKHHYDIRCFRAFTTIHLISRWTRRSTQQRAVDRAIISDVGAPCCGPPRDLLTAHSPQYSHSLRRKSATLSNLITRLICQPTFRQITWSLRGSVETRKARKHAADLRNSSRVSSANSEHFFRSLTREKIGSKKKQKTSTAL